MSDCIFMSENFWENHELLSGIQGAYCYNGLVDGIHLGSEKKEILFGKLHVCIFLLEYVSYH